MSVIGITGGSGSGKTTLLRALEALGGYGIDCDALYHHLLETDAALLRDIGARFPGVVECGTLQRKKLGALVFGDPAALADLNRITHACVCAAVKRLLSAHEDVPLVGIDAIALFESGLAELCDVTIAVTAPEALRVERLMLRDGITREYAQQRIRAQKSDAEFAAMADHVLVTSGTTPAEFMKQCTQFLKGVLK